METVEARKEKYREVAREVDSLIEKANDVPNGMFIQVLWASGEVTRIKRIERGSNALQVAGLFHTLATEWSASIIEGVPG